MKIIRTFSMLTIALTLISCREKIPTYNSYDEYPVYEGKDLGLNYAPEESTFKIWSPTATQAQLRLYNQDLGGEPVREINMNRENQGTWEVEIKEDLKGKYYTFRVKIGEKWLGEVPDPYAVAVGRNGKRAMVVDLSKTDPEGWEADQKPPLENFTDIILYELHFRDLSTHPNSGIRHKGKFLGLTETGTTSPKGLSTGLDHIKELGVTHIHLLPSFDFRSIDETKLEENKFNWGYDPQNYNTPEGSYSTDPADGRVRIREFKQMVKTLHDNGLRVVMDVVYNHTGETENSLFNQLVPGYYYRQNAEGGFSNASACGNETASERPMMRKFMIESLKHWVQEYHIDGFRFDLMGIHDIETMNAISKELHSIDPTIFLYGEGWTAGESPLPDEKKAIKKNTHLLDSIAAFSDDIRDGIKGHVFTRDARGFVSGEPELEESVKFGIVAATQHPQVNYDQVNYSDAPWAKNPSQAIIYASCHDNHTLWDRLVNSCPDEPEEELVKMHLLANTIVLTSQGVPFLHAGTEMLRSKQGVENSFESPDSINQIDWSRKARYKPVFDYYRELIKIRKNHPAFRMPTAEMIRQHVEFLDFDKNNLIGFLIKDSANGDSWKNILVVFNGNKERKNISIPEGNWNVICRNGEIREEGLKSHGRITSIIGRSALILAETK